MSKLLQSVIRHEPVVGFILGATNKTASINLATGGARLDSANARGKPRRYHNLTFKFMVNGTPATFAQMEKLENIKVEAQATHGTYTLREFDNAKEIVNFNRSKGHKVKEGYIDIHFTNWLAKTDVEQGCEALGTSDIVKLVITAQLETSHGLTSPIVELIASYDEIDEPMGIFTIIKKSNVNFGSGGKHYVTQTDEDLLNQGILQSITAMADDITNLELELDKERLFDVSHGDLEYLQQVMNKSGVNKTRIDNSNNVFHRDFGGNTISAGVPMVGREFKFTWTTSKSINTTVFYELVRGIDEKRNGMLIGLAR